jgi:hypothetical protein
VTILSPEDQTMVAEGEAVDLSGECDDPDIPYGDTLSYSWKTSRLGILGYGEVLAHAVLPVGHHRIKLTVEDDRGETSSSAVSLYVLPSETTDTDGDGISDVWELDHGMDPYDPDDALVEPYGDGRTYLDLYLREVAGSTGENPNGTDGGAGGNESGPGTGSVDDVQGVSVGAATGIALCVALALAAVVAMFVVLRSRKRREAGDVEAAAPAESPPGAPPPPGGGSVTGPVIATVGPVEPHGSPAPTGSSATPGPPTPTGPSTPVGHPAPSEPPTPVDHPAPSDHPTPVDHPAPSEAPAPAGPASPDPPGTVAPAGTATDDSPASAATDGSPAESAPSMEGGDGDATLDDLFSLEGGV